MSADLARDGLGLVVDGDDAGPPGLDRHHQGVLPAAPRPALRLAAHQGGAGVVRVWDTRGAAPVGNQGSGGRLERGTRAQDGGASVEVLEADLRNPEDRVFLRIKEQKKGYF